LLFSNCVPELSVIDKPTFDFTSFYKALVTTLASRGANWKQVSEATGVSQTTLSRMGRGRQPDAESLTALAAWSGLNPVEFVSGPRARPEPLALVGKILREDPNLDTNSAETLEAMLQAAYQRLKKD
jgi:transcriptional regulator with XRE-family HTH domain